MFNFYSSYLQSSTVILQNAVVLLELRYMICYLKGQLKYKGHDYIILENSGIGHRIFVAEKIMSNLNQGEEIDFYVHEYLRENVREFYGFKTIEELELFWQLLAISGVGPRMAQGIICLGSTEGLVKNIEKGNTDYISQVSGVGRKTAQKIIIELKGKLDLTSSGTEDDEVIQALKNLGYSGAQAREAVRKIPQDVDDISEKVREALRYLSK